MTSVEWLISVLAHNDILDHNKLSSNKQLYELYQRLKAHALEMEKLQELSAKEAYESGQKTMYCGCYSLSDATTYEEWYREQLKQKK